MELIDKVRHNHAFVTDNGDLYECFYVYGTTYLLINKMDDEDIEVYVDVFNNRFNLEKRLERMGIKYVIDKFGTVFQ